MYIVFHGLLSLAVHQSHLKIFLWNAQSKSSSVSQKTLWSWNLVYSLSMEVPRIPFSASHIAAAQHVLTMSPAFWSSTGLHAEARSLGARFSNSPLAEGELHNGLDSKESPNVSIVRFLPVNSVPSTYCQLAILPILVCPVRWQPRVGPLACPWLTS